MKIGRVFPTFQTELLYTEHYLAKELKKQGHETVFITSDKYMPMWDKYLSKKDPAGKYETNDFRVYRLESYFPLQKAIFKSPKKLSKIIKNEKFDVLHLYGLGTFSTLMILYLSFVKRRAFPEIIVSDHSDTRTHKREGAHAVLYYYFFALLLQVFKKNIRKVVTFVEDSIDLLGERFSIEKEKFQVIPLGYDQDTYKYRLELKNTESKFIIGYAGKIDEKKRVHVLIEAISKSQFVNQIKLIVVGFTDDDYGKYLQRLKIDKNVDVEFRPFANQEQLMSLYNYVDLAVYPGGISITTIEANGCGTPVVIYKSIQGLESRVENGRGLLFDSDLELIECIDHYFLLYEKGEINNVAIEKETFNASSWSKIKDSYLNLYNEIKKHGK